MAKKDKNMMEPAAPAALEPSQPKKEKKDKRKKKKKFPLVPLLVLLVVIGGITAVIGLNVLNIREQYIMPLLRQVPFVSQWFPAPAEEAEGETGPYAGLTQEDLISRLTASEYEVDKLESDLQAARDQKALDDATISNLREFESLVEETRQLKAEIDQAIADGDPQGFAEYFEEVSPENADAIYERIRQSQQYSSAVKLLSATYAEMDASAAADALQDMMAANADMVIGIFGGMDTRARARIFDEMEPGNVAIVSAFMYPEPTVIPTPTPIPALPLETLAAEETAAAEEAAATPEVITIP